MMGPAVGSMPDAMVWMMLGSYAPWTLLAALVVFLVLRLARATNERSNAKAILDERLARGELDAEEYRSRLALMKT